MCERGRDGEGMKCVSVSKGPVRIAKRGHRSRMQQTSLQKSSAAEMPPLGRTFDLTVRPLLDAVDKLRSMGVVEESINLPTIVVVGDQSSGKSSVLESLSGVELPKVQGFFTRVPLILRLKGSPLTKVIVSYKIPSTGEQRKEEIAEADIVNVLTSATDMLAGPGKGVAENPITLLVSKPGAPDLTLVDLPGITRVPVQGQPSNIYEQIHALIKVHIKPEESIILNVLSAATDFSVCESVHMSKEVDKLGKRTLAVVTKVDMCPDGLMEKVTNDVANIGLGYICVRNRTEKEGSFEEAIEAERLLFSSHAELRLLSKSTVGMEALASRLMEVQVQSIAGVLPGILKQVDDCIGKKWSELNQMGYEGIENAVDASIVFYNVSFSVRKSLESILSGGARDTGSTDQPPHHYLASLSQEFEKFASMLTHKLTTTHTSSSRQVDWAQLGQIKQLLSEYQSISLPGMISQHVIEKMVAQIINSIADTCTSDLPSFVHEEARKVALSVITKHVRKFPHLKKLYSAAFQTALNQCKGNCSRRIARLLEMEEAIIFTTESVLFNSLVNKLHGGRGQGNYRGDYYVSFDGLSGSLYMPLQRDTTGRVAVVEEAEKQAAFSVLAYWILLSRRLADDIPRELRFSFNEALLSATDEVVGQVAGGGMRIEEVMAEHPEVSNKRQHLTASLNVLQQSKDLISQVLDACFA